MPVCRCSHVFHELYCFLKRKSLAFTMVRELRQALVNQLNTAAINQAIGYHRHQHRRPAAHPRPAQRQTRPDRAASTRRNPRRVPAIRAHHRRRLPASPGTSGQRSADSIDRSTVSASSRRRYASFSSSLFTAAGLADVGPIPNHASGVRPRYASGTNRRSSSWCRRSLSRCSTRVHVSSRARIRPAPSTPRCPSCATRRTRRSLADAPSTSDSGRRTHAAHPSAPRAAATTGPPPRLAPPRRRPERSPAAAACTAAPQPRAHCGPT